jgi:hypothetical protein
MKRLKYRAGRCSRVGVEEEATELDAWVRGARVLHLSCRRPRASLVRRLATNLLLMNTQANEIMCSFDQIYENLDASLTRLLLLKSEL